MPDGSGHVACVTRVLSRAGSCGELGASNHLGKIPNIVTQSIDCRRDLDPQQCILSRFIGGLLYVSKTRTQLRDHEPGINHSPPSLYPASAPLGIPPPRLSFIATAAASMRRFVFRHMAEIFIQLPGTAAGTRTPATAAPPPRRRVRLGFGPRGTTPSTVSSAMSGDAPVRDESSYMALYLRLFVRLRGTDRYRSAVVWISR